MLARSHQLQSIFRLLKPFLHVQIWCQSVAVFQNLGVLQCTFITCHRSWSAALCEIYFCIFHLKTTLNGGQFLILFCLRARLHFWICNLYELRGRGQTHNKMKGSSRGHFLRQSATSRFLSPARPLCLSVCLSRAKETVFIGESVMAKHRDSKLRFGELLPVSVAVKTSHTALKQTAQATSELNRKFCSLNQH